MKRIKRFIGSVYQTYHENIEAILSFLLIFITFVVPMIILTWIEMLSKGGSDFEVAPLIIQIIVCVIISFFKYVIGLFIILAGIVLCGFWLFKTLYDIYDTFRHYPYKKKIKSYYFNTIRFFKDIKRLWKESEIKNEKK